jgi:hypothetical protein
VDSLLDFNALSDHQGLREGCVNLYGTTDPPVLDQGGPKSVTACAATEEDESPETLQQRLPRAAHRLAPQASQCNRFVRVQKEQERKILLPSLCSFERSSCFASPMIAMDCYRYQQQYCISNTTLSYRMKPESQTNIETKSEPRCVPQYALFLLSVD